MQIEFSESTDENLVTFLNEKINSETAQFGTAYPFSLSIRDDEGAVIAGANGFVIYGTIYTDQLWVDKAYRGKGYGRMLMDKVHAYGQREGCRMATIQTMDFQDAVPFYKKLGYVIDFEREGYVNGSRCIFMKKNI